MEADELAGGRSILCLGAGEMAKRLRKCIALVEDQGLLPSTHMVTHKHSGPNALSGLHGHCTNSVCIHTYRPTCT